MVLEFNDFDLPTGEWELAYGKQIGACAKRLDITVNEYEKIDKVDRENIWEETKQMFHIEDPSGEWQKRFHSAVASRFSCHKSNLRARFITFKNPHPATSPKENMKPWEVYEGYFTKEKWKRFEIYSKSAEFMEENLQKQSKESEERECKQSERGVDALTLAFGKKDHRGFVKGLGGCGIGVGYRKAFGLVKVDEFSGNSVIVADGATEPCPSGVIHNKKMNCDIYKVNVDHVYSDYSHLNLLKETHDSITKLGEAKGYFLGWPADLVFFTDEVMTLAKKTDNELV